MTNRRRRHQSELGFTLAEIIVAVAIFAVIFIAALAIYDQSNKVFKTGVENSEMQQTTRVAFDKLVSDIRMAGFDFDRDGIPSGSTTNASTGATINQYQQPDEQIEYVGASAITIRGNFDFETDAAHENGRESGDGTAAHPDYESSQFPVVTTENDEIVTYVLESADSAKNTQSVTFYADTDVPRDVYPGTGGKSENLVTISGVDLTNNNPPYTLVRVTLDNNKAVVRTPLANNIRSMTFQYYEDYSGIKPLTNLNGTEITQANLASTVGGLGQYNPNDPASSAVPRGIRGKVQSVRLTLIGMSEAPDLSYTNPDEPLSTNVKLADGSMANIRNFRQYRLESLITPRNFAKRGIREQEDRPPGQPTLKSVCWGWCGTAYVTWEAPLPDASTGSVETYAVLYCDASAGACTPTIPFQAGLATSTFVGGLNPNHSYTFTVEAINSFGAATASTTYTASMANLAQPQAPQNVVATGGPSPAPPAQPNAIALTWTRPLSASGSLSCSAGTAPTGNTAMPIEEIRGWKIDRRIVGTDPATGNPYPFVPWVDYDATDPRAPVIDPLTNTVTWVDANSLTDKTHYVVNCVDYEYRIREVEGGNPPCNPGSATSGISGYSTIVRGRAESDVKPAAPTALNIDSAQSSCTNGGNCSVALTWPAVRTDVNNTPIMALSYHLHIYQKLESDPTFPMTEMAGAPLLVDVISPVAGVDATFDETTGMVTATIDQKKTSGFLPEKDPSSGQDYQYRFVVTAVQCGSPDSDPSPEQIYPCDMGGVTFSTSMSVLVEGTGTIASPWVTSAPANVDVAVKDSAGAPATVDEISAKALIGNDTVDLGTQGGPISTASFGWPSGMTDGVVYTLQVTIKKGLCTNTQSYYVMETANNCCLTPRATRDGTLIDPSVMTFDGPSQLVKVRLINTCDQDLTITSIEIKWDNAFLNGKGSKKLDHVTYPPVSGTTRAVDTIGTTGTPVTTQPSSASPAASAIIPAGSSSYYIEIYFSQPFSGSPVTQVCVQYTTATGNDTCQIVPSPSLNDSTCD
ncbi:MAG: hypothetical protein WBX15_03380 [Thermoanaerobaculia bacterium]